MRITGTELIGWALLNSFWQFALLAFLYLVITGRDTRFTAAIRHNIALAFSIAGSVWFIGGLFASGTPVSEVIPDSPTIPGSHLDSFAPGFDVLPQLNRLIASLPFLYAGVLLLRSANACRGLLKRRETADNGYREGGWNEWQGFLDKCRREFGISRDVLLRWTGGPGMASTYGFFRPVVLFPLVLISQLSTAQVEAILVHELAHIRRNDFLTHLWMSFFRFVFYFNPFACFFYEVVSFEREQACDDLVLGRSYPAVVYAQALMALEKFRQSQLKLSLAASGHRPLQLADRIRRMTGLRVPPANRRPLLRLLIGVLLLALTFYGIKPLLRSRHARQVEPGRTVALFPMMQPDGIAQDPVAPRVLPAAPLSVPTPHPVAAPPAALNEYSTLALPRTVTDGRSHPLPKLPPTRKAGRLLEEVNHDVSDDVTDYAIPEQTGLLPAPDNSVDNIDTGTETDEPAYAATKTIRNFTYKNFETVVVPEVRNLQPFVPSSSFERPQLDSVPVVALQSLQANKRLVVQLLARWKTLQLQQNISLALELQYQKLKEKTQKDVRGLPAKKAELKKSLENLQEQIRIRKTEMDRLSAILAEEPVIYI